MALSLTTILLILFGLLVLKLLWPRYVKYRKICKALDKLPGPKTTFLLGNLLDVRANNNVDQFRKSRGIAIKYQNEGYGFHRHWITSLGPTVMIYRADHLEQFMTSSTNLTKAFAYKFLESWLGTGLLTSHGQKWQTRRKLLTPAFHFKILEDYAPIFDKHSRKLVEKLRTVGQNSREFDISKIYGLSTLDMICETAMGKQMNAINDESSSYVRAVKRASELMNVRFFSPWLWFKIIFDSCAIGRKYNHNVRVMHKFTREIIMERKKEWATNENRSTKKYRPFLDLLLDTRALTDDDLMEEVNTFMFEGHDTTAMGLNWATYLLGHHPEVQERIVEESNNVLGNSDRPITLEDLKELRYLDCVIKECQRIYPSVPQFNRDLTSDIKLGGDYVAPSGATIVVLTYQLHRDPDVFPDPEKFDPDRFLPENSVGRSPFAYLPFSAGLRNCIGQKFALAEMKIVLLHVLRNFVVTSLHQRNQMELLRELVLRPNNGIWVRLLPRK